VAWSSNNYTVLAITVGVRMSRTTLRLRRVSTNRSRWKEILLYEGVQRRNRVVQYMCTLFAIEYPPREDFEGGNYSATLFSFPQIRSIFVYTRFVESLYCTYGIWATTRHGPSHVVVVVVVVV